MPPPGRPAFPEKRLLYLLKTELLKNLLTLSVRGGKLVIQEGVKEPVNPTPCRSTDFAVLR